MTDCNVFPKSSGCYSYDSEWNCMYSGGLAGYTAINASLENAMNIVRLEYCVGLTDIPHDYVIVDSMTQAQGYNSSLNITVCSYTGTATQCLISCSCCNCCCCGAIPLHTFTTGNYCAGALASTHDCNVTPSIGSSTICSCIASENITISGKCAFCFCVCCYRSLGNCYGNCVCLNASIAGSHDNYSIACCYAGNNVENCSVVNCYCYYNVSANCWDFYCNGTCKCQVTQVAFPNIVFCVCAYSINCYTNTGSTWYACGAFCVVGICTYCNCYSTSCYTAGACCLTNYYYNCYNCHLCQSKLSTNIVCWALPIRATYLDLKKSGTGTVVYNVVNAANNFCLCCNLLSKCLYFMTCCVCCHRYEIIQCSDNVSCIKSYAVAVGV